ncbi:hypothetical protein [Thaumasiovibrio subtropicus]|uniref:hypothetical protein n=1 Tax=Thaumasiovibrio subtropicus TaxID=1891207 RepID=UPI001C851FC8|nr:hypothetical protein [Thaumasiovibrio subtropicus]
MDKLYTLTNSDDLAGFLGSMSLLDDGMPADSAVWSDWLEAIEKASQDPDIRLKIMSNWRDNLEQEE